MGTGGMGTGGSGGMGAGGGAGGAGGIRRLPEIFTVNGKRVMVVSVDDNDAGMDTLDKVENPTSEGDIAKAFNEPAKACIPSDTPTATGMCVNENLVAQACSNMIVATSRNCGGNQFCCFADR